MENRILSIIVICYNNLQGLKKTLDSIFSQTFEQYEVVVVDGGSTDGTLSYLQNIENKSNLKWISEPDDGIADAMMKGVSLSSGSMLQFLNSGDWFISNHILDSISKYIFDETFIWGYGFAKIVDNNGNVYRKTKIEPFNKAGIIYSYVQPISHQAMFVNIKAYDKSGGYNQKLKYAMDYDLIIKLLSVSDPVVIPEYVVNYNAFGTSYEKIRESLLQKYTIRSEVVPNNKFSKMVDYIWTNIYSYVLITKRNIKRFVKSRVK